LSRQNLPTLDRTKFAAASGVAKGAYVLLDPPSGKPDCILIGTGSELQLCIDASVRLAELGVAARVVSMPCWDLFAEQDALYRESVLPMNVTARVACEAAAGFGWEKWIGSHGRFVGMNGFGASAPAPVLYKHFGICVEAIVEAAQQQLL